MPWASSSRSRESPSQPGKVKWALAGRRSHGVAAQDRVRNRRTDGRRPGRRAGRRSRGRTTPAARRRAARPPRRRRRRARRGCRSGRAAPARRRAARVRGCTRGRAAARRCRTGRRSCGRRRSSRRGPESAKSTGDLTEGLDGVGVQRDAELALPRRRVRGPAGSCRSRCWPTSRWPGRRRRGCGRWPRAGRRGGPGRTGRPGGTRRRRPRARRASATASRTAWCSTGLARTRVRAGSASRRDQYRPLTARLSASVPPEVNTTSLGRAPSASASVSRASSTVRRALRPAAWSEEALPVTASCAVIASTASGSIGVVAAWSRYAMVP